MFDPSKLDLDLDDSKKKNIPSSKEDIKKALSSVEKKQESVEEILEENSVLEKFDNPLLEEEMQENPKIQTKTVHETFMEDDAKRDEIKAEEKAIEEKQEQVQEENII